ncbi:ATP-dependent DNA helicase RecG [Ferruginibacter lapsinanis]|uniref:ATP-dependent DNA helicase RecG n=1 Tax=Ferruginibacter lapsinanis TaxID=563172 RepID=UPI001E612573|nr:ATP-dependent DNA helicase RecG [Ferruginibacter lapsinanis]UEG51321.1 ATP-dependent DNA helicase RecG [Ferruginibacter lapsinanis]
MLFSPIEYLKGVGPLRGDMLKKELNIFTYKDLLEHYPLRHLDKTKVDKIRSINFNADYVQVAGKLMHFDIVGEKRSKRLVAYLQDDTGEIELTWFQGINWVTKTLHTGHHYLVFGKVGSFMGKIQIVHPEIEPYTEEKAGGKKFLEPIYPSTEKLKVRGLNGRMLAKLTYALLQQLSPKDLPENLPESIIKQYRFISRWEANCHIHFPATEEMYKHAVRRLKFEELFFAQVRLGLIRSTRHRFSKGWIFDKVGDFFNTFYNEFLPFELTNAQKRVLKEIRKDAGSGKQMNRLLQGDVGSGKTIVALLSMLIAADNNFQSVLMAPTEILAQQHFNGITAVLGTMNIEVRLLTGSTKTKERKEILTKCEDGSLHILIGTHAVIEDKVQFKNLGFAVIDEQHKFGVAQRAKLWKKNSLPPHILVMTATPIPRTLALTAYGDLDYSVIDELPPGRQPINTIHRFESKRPQVMDFLRQEIEKGRQAYVVYPLIEESSKVDYENLMKGFEEVKSFFPEPKFWISMVHGKQPAEQKEVNMKRFVTGDTNIMVSTTVIEVGVNVPNASVMVIESAEKFGLSQLHQLRGRVGRGAEKSFCILLTGNKLSAEAKERLKILCATNDGFAVAEKDLEIRGPGDIEGTRQSGDLNFKIANIVQDRIMLEAAKEAANVIVENDPEFTMAENLPVKEYLQWQKGKTIWSKIS